MSVSNFHNTMQEATNMEDSNFFTNGNYSEQSIKEKYIEAYQALYDVFKNKSAEGIDDELMQELIGALSDYEELDKAEIARRLRFRIKRALWI